MSGVHNPKSSPELDAEKELLEQTVRNEFEGTDRTAIRELPQIIAYNAYYRQFRKTFHLQGQLESIAFKNRSIPMVAALVEAMFMAELKNVLLTAGHDCSRIQQPVRLDVATGDEIYETLSGKEQQLKPGDMMFTDATGVISSVIYGPDRRTRIDSDTTEVLFTIYAPAGISLNQIDQHLQDIRDYVLIVSPDANVESISII